MNNAGVQPGSDMLGRAANCERVLGVNLWRVIHGTHVFVSGMIKRGRSPIGAEQRQECRWRHETDGISPHPRPGLRRRG